MKPYVLCIRQLGGIGDCLSMSPVFRGLREKYGRKREIHLATSEAHAGAALLDIARHNSFIDRIHVVEPFTATTERTSLVWGKDLEKAPRIESTELYRQAVEVIDLNTACVDYEWPAMDSEAGIQKPRYQVWAEHAQVMPSTWFPVYEMTRHEAKQGCEFWSKRGLDPSRCIGVALASADPKRALGVEKLKTVCALIRQRGYIPFTFDSITRLEGVEGVVGKRLSDVVPIIANLPVMITADSGLLHIAGAVRVPVVGIFGPTDPAMRMLPYKGVSVSIGPLLPCSPCWYKYPCLKEINPKLHLRCIDLLKPGIIVEAAIRLIGLDYSATCLRV